MQAHCESIQLPKSACSTSPWCLGMLKLTCTMGHPTGFPLANPRRWYIHEDRPRHAHEKPTLETPKRGIWRRGFGAPNSCFLGISSGIGPLLSPRSHTLGLLRKRNHEEPHDELRHQADDGKICHTTADECGPAPRDHYSLFLIG